MSRAGSGLVLVVEDDEGTALTLEAILGQVGYEVRRAVGAREALAAIEARRPVAVVADISMPGGSGMTLLGSLRAREEIAALPVLLATARDDSAIAWEVTKDPHARYLRKPYQPAAVLASLEELLG